MRAQVVQSSERYARRNGKWSKVDRDGKGKWYVAMGWKGQLIATRVARGLPTKRDAIERGDAWLDDRG
jgi:hypothetical protein